MKQDENNSKHYVADDGKVFRRKYDRQVFGSELYLGFTYYLAGQKLDRGIPEYIEDYEEIDEDATVTLEDPVNEDPITEDCKITLSDYKALEDKVNKLMELLQ